MTMKTILCLSAALALFSGCGEPAITYPQALEIIFLPLDGARGLGQDTIPSMVFSDELDENSIGGSAVSLQATTWSCISQEGQGEKCTCGNGWSPVAGTAEADHTVLKFTPSSPLPAKSCLVMVCTTAVRGKNTAPLRPLGLPAEAKAALGLAAGIEVGALQQFWTAE